MSAPSLPFLTPRFDDALAYASALHRSQTRKGTAIPYVSHLLAVAAIALENGADEDQAIAALLHDAVEDQGGLAQLAAIRARFGDEVAGIVADCTDAHEDPNPPGGHARRPISPALRTNPRARSRSASPTRLTTLPRSTPICARLAARCGIGSPVGGTARCGITVRCPTPSRRWSPASLPRVSGAKWRKWRSWRRAGDALLRKARARCAGTRAQGRRSSSACFRIRNIADQKISVIARRIG